MASQATALLFKSRHLPTDFDERIYLDLNPDVAAAVTDRTWFSGAAHFLSWGRSEGRDYALPLPMDFDESAYLEANPDAADSIKAGDLESGAVHWRVRGRHEGRRQWSRVPWHDLPTDFEEADYLDCNPDVRDAIAAGAFDSGASHFRAKGRAEGRGYAAHHPFARRAEPERPIEWPAARLPVRFGEAVDATAYARRNPDLSSGDLRDGAHAHWLSTGYRQGRCPIGFRPYQKRKMTAGFWHRRNAVNLYGMLDAPGARGARARAYRAALAGAGLCHDVVTIHARYDLATTPDVRAPASERSPANKVNIFALDAELTHRFFYDGRCYLLDDSFNIALWTCGAAAIPAEWASAFGAYDEIWVPNDATRRAVATISPVPVVVMPDAPRVRRGLGDRVRGRLEALRLFDDVPNDVVPFALGRRSATRCFADDGPMISVVVPVFDIESALLRKCINSVAAQTYRNWELILQDDGSLHADTLDELERHRGTDHRIRIARSDRNRGIAAATNAAIALASGEFIAFLDDDDELTLDALETMAAAIAANPTADLLYSDEDKIDSDGRFCDHYFKPDWSPEHLESCAYLLHLTVMRRATILAAGGLRSAYDGAQDFDLSLRVSEVARHVVHVPKILYHWRKSPGSAAAKVDAKPKALRRARAALEDHLTTRGRDAAVAPGLAPGLFRVRDRVEPGTPVTLVILTDNRTTDVEGRGRINLFDHFFESILDKTKTSCAIRYLVVDNHNLSELQTRQIAASGGHVLGDAIPRSHVNIAHKTNVAVSQVKTELFVILRDDMEVIDPDWLDALVELAQRPTSGAVGGRLLYPDDRIQHCGVVFGGEDRVGHIFHRLEAEIVGYNHYTHIIRNYLAVSGACMATRKSVFEEIGGFDERYGGRFSDTDFCLRAHAAGYRNIYTPFATLYRFEDSKPRRQDDAEADAFFENWQHVIARDPYYNPDLAR